LFLSIRPLAAAGVVLLLAGCGTTAPVTAHRGARSDAAAPARMPSASDPLRVLMVGDSVAAELRLPVEEALEAGGAGTVRYVSQPSLPRDAGYLQIWDDALAEDRPELVIVLVGYWEQRIYSTAPGGLPSEPEYRRDHLEPFVRSATAIGAEVLWVGAPALADATASEVLTELNVRYEQLAAEEPGVAFLDGNAPVAGPGGAFAEVIETSTGPQRVRAPDGLHLCPDGGVLVATSVLGWVMDRWDVPLGDRWQAGDWRSHPFSASTVCPPL
jgi:hypothetical protein